MSGKIRIRRGSSNDLPPLEQGEFGYALDTQELAIGGLNGNDLIGSGQQGSTGPQGVTGASGEIALPAIYYVPGNFSTIQEAIDFAHFTEGHTGNVSNPAVVEIAPGIYNENLTLRAGVSLAGRTANGSNVNIFGDATFTSVISQSQNENRVCLQGLTITGKFEVTGAFANRVTARNCGLINTNSDPTLRLNGSQARFDALSCFISHSNPAVTTVDVVNGQFFASGMSGFVLNSSASVTASLIKIGGLNGQATFHGTNIGGGAGNFSYSNMIEIASSTAFVSVRNCVMLNNLSGGSNFLYSANGTVDIVNSYIQNNSGFYATTTSGGGTLRSDLNVINGVNRVDSAINIQRSGKTGLRFDPFFNKLYVGGLNGFPTFTAAINYATAKSLNFVNLIVEGGTYVEDIVIPPDMSLKITAESGALYNFPQIFVIGSIIHNPNSDTQFTVSGLHITAPVGKSCLYYTAGVQTWPSFRYCEFRKQDADTTTPVIFVDAITAPTFFDCIFDASSGGPLFDIKGTNFTVRGLNIFGRTDFSAGNSPADPTFSTPIIKLRDDSSMILNGVVSNIGLFGTVFELNNNCEISFNGCEIGSSQNGGQMFYFKGTNSNVWADYSTFNTAGNPHPPEMNGPSYHALCRDGLPATGTITIINNSFEVGDSVSINGTEFVVNVDFAVGANINDTAFNLAQAINSGVLTQVAYAIVNANVLTIYSYKFAASSNSITLAINDNVTSNFIISGPTLTGGTNGPGTNNFHRNFCAFDGWSVYSQDTINDMVPVQVPFFF